MTLYIHYPFEGRWYSFVDADKTIYYDRTLVSLSHAFRIPLFDFGFPDVHFYFPKLCSSDLIALSATQQRIQITLVFLGCLKSN